MCLGCNILVRHTLKVGIELHAAFLCCFCLFLLLWDNVDFLIIMCQIF